ncbi:DHA2 family efflux MFS transporter permease subunit [Dactylosporangium sp. NPDC051485]|uniref:DHA2 family efflux MFS transporter permease subunit n=1 Tax=Dactylosporangium sp. NPDC051485 TaxID=3154846 RepID=UPI0034433E94
MTTTPTTTSTQRWVLGLASVASFMVILDMLVVATALSTIQRDLGASLADLEWTVNAYTLSFACLILTGAALGDRLGRRAVFAAGLALFSLASAGCALAPSVGWLIAARMVQGAGAALVMPLALALLNAAFPPQRRGWALGVYGAVTGLAATVGPVAGGAATEGLAWQWIFWINVPIGLLAVPPLLARTPESRGARAPLDLPALLLSAVAALGVVWALVRGNAEGWTAPATLAPLAAGLLAGAGFVLREARTAAPMVPLRLFRSRPFTGGNLVVFFANAGLTGAVFFTAQCFQVLYGHGAFVAGLWLLPLGVAPALVAPRAGALADRFGERALIVAGTLLLAAGFAWTGLAARAGGPYLALVVPLTLAGTGIISISVATRAVVSRVAPAEMAKAGGIFSTLRQLGGAFGVALLGAVFAGAGGTFSTGFHTAMLVAAALALAGTASGLAVSAPPRPDTACDAQAVPVPAGSAGRPGPGSSG